MRQAGRASIAVRRAWPSIVKAELFSPSNAGTEASRLPPARRAGAARSAVTLVGVLVDAAEAGEMLQRAVHAGQPSASRSRAPATSVTTAGSFEIARVEMREAVLRIDHAVIEIDHRREVEIDAERRKLASLPRRILADREQPLGRVAMDRDDLGHRRHAGERRRHARHRPPS